MPYIIRENTLALIPYGKKTKVVEDKKSYLINEATPDIVSRNCYINGSTLEGRQKGSSFLIGSRCKPPIVINETANIIFIPTHSIRNLNCNWISLRAILHYYPASNNRVLIEFYNHKKIFIDTSYYIFDKQVLRATRLESSLKGRIYQKFL